MGINLSGVMGPEILGRVRRAMEERRCRERNDESILFLRRAKATLLFRYRFGILLGDLCYGEDENWKQIGAGGSGGTLGFLNQAR